MPGGGRRSASHPSPGGPGQGVQAPAPSCCSRRPEGCSAAPSPHGEQKGCWADGHAWGALGGVPGQRLCPTVNGAGHERASPPPALTEDGPGARRHPAPPAHLLHPQHTPSKPNSAPVHPQHPQAAPCRVRCRSWQCAQPRALLQVPPPGARLAAFGAEGAAGGAGGAGVRGEPAQGQPTRGCGMRDAGCGRQQVELALQRTQRGERAPSPHPASAPPGRAGQRGGHPGAERSRGLVRSWGCAQPRAGSCRGLARGHPVRGARCGTSGLGTPAMGHLVWDNWCGAPAVGQLREAAHTARGHPHTHGGAALCSAHGAQLPLGHARHSEQDQELPWPLLAGCCCPRAWGWVLWVQTSPVRPFPCRQRGREAAKPKRRVYFPPGKQHFDMSQQVSQTRVDRKCVQAGEMLFICIKLQSDSVKLICGISLASAGTAGSSGTVSQEPPRAPMRVAQPMGLVGTLSAPQCPKAPRCWLWSCQGTRGGRQDTAGHATPQPSGLFPPPQPSPALPNPSRGPWSCPGVPADAQGLALWL